MKLFLRHTLLLVIILIDNFCYSQDNQKVHWSFSQLKDSSMTTVVIHASIETGWHLYSQVQESNDGPIPTSFTFTENSNYKLVGNIIEITSPIKVYDKAFDMTLSFFENNADFFQKVQMNTNDETTFTGTINYMVCDGQMCLPPTDVPIVMVLNKSANIYDE